MTRVAAIGFLLAAPACDDGAAGDGSSGDPPGPGADSGSPHPGERVTVSDPTWRLHETMPSLVWVSWTQDRPATVRVEYSFDPDEWLSSPPAQATAGENERLIVGIPFGTVAQWRVVVDGSATPPVDGPAITTGALSEGFPVGTVTVSDPAGWWSEGRWLLTSISQEPRGWSGGDYWTYIMDRRGRVVWATLAPDRHWTLFPQISVTGDHLLWDEATYWVMPGQSEGEDGVVHRTWLDEEIEVVPTPGLHHAFLELPDGSLVWGSQAHGGGEALVKRAPGASEVEILWTVEEDWPDAYWVWVESNGLFYDPVAQRFLYSYYTNNAVVEIDATTGASTWWAGEVPGGYAFDPISAQYRWQHGISYTEAGTLLLSSERPNGNTWLMEYEVDRAAEALRLVWSNDSGVRADTNGQAWRLPNGNTLHVVGSAGVVREVGAGDLDVWRVEYGDGHLLGNGHFIADLYALVKPGG